MNSEEIIIETDQADIPALYYEGRPNSPLAIYHHGLHGTKDGFNAQAFEKMATEQGYGFLSIDNLSHGALKSFPLENANMSGWVKTATDTIDAITQGGRDLLFIGNSWGAGVLANAARTLENNIAGFFGVSAAPDVWQEEIWNGLQQEFQNVPDLKNHFETGAEIRVPFPGAEHPVPLSQALFDDAKKFSVLDGDPLFSCPATLVYGTKDPFIEPTKAERFKACFSNGANMVPCDDGHELAHSRGEINSAFQTFISNIQKRQL